MWDIEIRTDSKGRRVFINTWKSKDDKILEKIMSEILKFKVTGPQNVTAQDCINGLMETHAVPVQMTRIKLIMSAIRNERKAILLALHNGPNVRDLAWKEACVAHNLKDPTRHLGHC